MFSRRDDSTGLYPFLENYITLDVTETKCFTDAVHLTNMPQHYTGDAFGYLPDCSCNVTTTTATTTTTTSAAFKDCFASLGGANYG